MGETRFARLHAWRQHWRRSFGYMAPIRDSRARGLWPQRIEVPEGYTGMRVLVARGDRFGDMMLTLPFLARVLASGADLRVIVPDRHARLLLARRGIRSFASAAALAEGDPEWKPDWVFLAEPCRRLRSARHPERWRFVEETLGAFRGAHFAVPVMRPGEAMSVYPGSYCTPASGISAIALLDRYADGLGLVRASRPLLHDWCSTPESRREGAIVLNLSAGRAGESDRRDLSVRFWSTVAEGLGDRVRVACIVQPGDERLREQAQANRRLAKGGDVACFHDASDAAIWLGRQRLLISPETGLCHLARNLALPMVVLTPKRKVPYFYPVEPGTGFVFAKALHAIEPQQVLARARALLAEPA